MGIVTWETREGDCIERMRELDDDSIDAVVCDPPYSLGFMGRAWDSHGEDEDAGFGYYLAGLIDGEGCFRVGAGERRCEFTMKLRDDDRWILEQTRRFVRHGRISAEKRREGSAPQAKLVIDTKDGCAALCSLLMRYPLRAKKLRDFLTWAEAVDEWLSMPRGNRWHGPADKARLAALGQRLKAGRVYSEVPWSGNAFQDWTRAWASEALRVLKPGGHLLAFGGSRTYHRLAAGFEDAGFEVRDCIQYLYGSGFPKSLDVSKAIDKAAGAEREVVGPSPHSRNRTASSYQADDTDHGYIGRPEGERIVSAPATPEAERWQGWGTALKPSHEPIVVARKPLIGTVTANVLEHGTGALNIAGCRIETDEVGERRSDRPRDGDPDWRMPGGSSGNGASSPDGRWPANVVLSEEAAAELDEQAGESVSRIGKPRAGQNGDGWGMTATGAEYDDQGGPSRFFYCAKTSRAERNAGLEGFEERIVKITEGHGLGEVNTSKGDGTGIRENRPRANVHPTVKPINLMRWLVRLVTPPGGLVLDPFTGSGSTGCAAVLEGFDFIGIEREAEYVAIAEARIAFWAQHQGREIKDVLGIYAESLHQAKQHADAGQLDLG